MHQALEAGEILQRYDVRAAKAETGNRTTTYRDRSGTGSWIGR